VSKEAKAMFRLSNPVIGGALVAVATSFPASPNAAQAIPDDFVIKLERTSCYGPCPIYMVSIDGNGKVTYEGRKFVRVEGRQSDNIPAGRVAALVSTVNRIRFFELNDEYRFIRNADGTTTSVTDLPTTFVTVTQGGRTKRIEDYVGAPEPLHQLEKEIDEAARTKRWISLDDPTLRQMVRDGQAPSAEERAELLRKALEEDAVDVITGLIEIGTDPNHNYGSNTTPLMMVRSAAAARALIAGGAIPYTRSERGVTPLSWSVHLAPGVAEVLLKAGVQPDEPDSYSRTPLWQAACEGNAGVVKLLLNAGADPTRRAVGVSPLECARQGQERERARRPLPIGTPLYVRDFDTVIALLEQALARRQRK
jgi:Domain of unknown function (DUF6438)/Ankyrin repeats (3 copies)